MAIKRAIPTDAAFYTEVKSTLDELINRSLAAQERWARLRDVTTAKEFETEWNALPDQDSVPQRRIRSLLGPPDIPTS